MNVQIRLEEIVEVLKLGVRRTAAFMGLGVNVALDPDFKQVTLPANVSNFRILPEPIPDELLANIKDEFKLWIEANGLRELCESLEVYLTAIYRTAMVVAVSNNGHIPPNTHLSIPKDFLRKGLRTKLTMLQNDYGVGPGHPEHLASLWDARNCLTHRRGVVGPEDVGPSGTLTIKWLGIDSYFVDPQGNETLLERDFAPIYARDGGSVKLIVADRIRQFSPGDRIVFSPHDLSEICWFSLAQSDGIVSSLMALMKNKGIPFQIGDAPSQTAPDSASTAEPDAASEATPE